MKKMLLTILASFTLVSAASAETYVCGSDGKPLMIGDSCVVAAGGNGDAFEQCGSDAANKAAMADKAAMAADKAAMKPAPRVITKVVVDCTKCN